MINLEEVLARVKVTYGSMDSPDFSFVGKAMERNPYAALVAELEERFEIEEDTDPNDDVSFGYILSKASKRWVLRVSMVGPYAALLRIRNGDAVEALSSPSLSDLEDEKYIQSVLVVASLHLLSRDELEAPVAMNLFNTEAEHVKLYQVLFSDTDILPWN